MSKEAMKLALDALEASKDLVISARRNMEYQHNASAMASLPQLADLEKRHLEAIDAMQEALAQPQQEPMPWKHDCAALLMNGVELWVDHCPHCGKPRTSPPARKPLTDERISAIAISTPPIVHALARAIEAAHGIKDTPC